MAGDDVAQSKRERDARSREAEQQAPSADNGAAEQDGASTLKRAVKAGAVAAAAGTTVAAAAKLFGSKDGGDSNGDQEPGEKARPSARVRGAASRASKRGEPFMAAGWEAARDSVMPLAENAARAAGRFAAERSPELVRDRIVPPFIEGFTQARKRAS